MDLSKPQTLNAGDWDNFSEKKKVFLQELDKCRGVVSVAAMNTGIYRDTHYKWMEKDERYARAVKIIRYTAVDYVESKLFQRIDNNDTIAIMFYLNNMGKDRGYGKGSDSSIGEGKTLPAPIINIRPLSKPPEPPPDGPVTTPE